MLPALLAHGVTQAQIDQMMIENPGRYFTKAVGMTDHSDLGGIFDMTGVSRGPDGIKRYQGLPRNLVHMLRAAVEPRAPPRPWWKPAAARG